MIVAGNSRSRTEQRRMETRQSHRSPCLNYRFVRFCRDLYASEAAITKFRFYSIWRVLAVSNAEGVDSRLTATLQAILTASRFLDRGDAVVINKAAQIALNHAAAAAAAEITVEGEGRGAAANDSQGGDPEMHKGWPGPNLASLSLLTLLHVSQNRWEGIPAALDVLQEMVRE